jgi:predicted methyltransferase
VASEPAADPAPIPDVPTVDDPEVPPDIAAAVAAKDRSSEDRDLDAGRQPAKMLAFFEIERGMRIAELGAGRGYTAELLARIVGPEGEVYGQNTPLILKRFAERPWSERLEKPLMNHVRRVDSEFDDPLPGIDDLDAVLMVLFYHDTVWMETDRDQMLKSIFDSLAPGGVFGIVDHAAAPGRGASDAEPLHRVEEGTVIAEVQRAGFVLEARCTALENPDDPHDWNASPRAAGARRGTSDRFMLRFRKPSPKG